ncbi:putative immunity protein [Mycobacterium sp. IDR2000157661]|uniref:putative immunity protein n=1 Tax=Mycobacterium sp. IDR2000157661 TaxID=2867005 RepID=UPI001EEAB1F0|nr:hypothetical protein [Mycobacterium sp. IDR2000157661]
MADASIDLGMTELREVASYAAACARTALPIFSAGRPDDARARAAAHAARAFELSAGGDPSVADDHLGRARDAATAAVAAVLARYPPAPPGGGRVGELMWALDALLR